jgi:hypothetical protein
MMINEQWIGGNRKEVVVVDFEVDTALAAFEGNDKNTTSPLGHDCIWDLPNKK